MLIQNDTGSVNHEKKYSRFEVGKEVANGISRYLYMPEECDPARATDYR